MYRKELKKVPYEKQGDLITGYKILLQDQQVATLEFRNGDWIGAIFTEGHSMTFENKKENDTDWSGCHSLNRIGGNKISIFILQKLKKFVKKRW